MKHGKIMAVAGAGAVLIAGGFTVAADAQSKSSSSSSTQAAKARARGAFSSAQISALAEKLGVSTTTLRAALRDIKPSKPAAPSGRGTDMANALASELGVDAAKVKEILDANRPARGERPAPGERPDQSALVTALANGLDLDEATVKAALDKIHAAHEAAHEARHAAFAAKLADRMGLSTEAVQAALGSVRPAQPERAGASGR